MNGPFDHVLRRKQLEQFACLLAERRRRKEKALHKQRGYRDEETGEWVGGLLSFTKYFWHILEPGRELVAGWPLEAICLPYDTKIITQEGPKSIGDVVEGRWAGNVLSFNHATLKTEWKSIVYHMKSAGKLLIKIGVDGTVLRITDNHPIFTLERGYVPAGQIKVGDTLQLCSMQNGILGSPKPKSILQPTVLARQSIRQCTRKKFAKLQAVWKEFLSSTIKANRGLLFAQMPRDIEDNPRKGRVPEVRQLQVMGREGLPNLLRSKQKTRASSCLRELRKGHISRASEVGRGQTCLWGILRDEVHGNGISWQEQHLLHKRETSGEVPSRVLDRARGRLEAGKAALFSLFEKIEAGCAPHQSGYGEQRSLEFGRPLPQMPLCAARASDGEAQPRCSNEVSFATVDSVERDQWISDEVYNIEVLGNNNYYAENILVHNCEHLEAVTFGEIKKLLMNVPPGFMKSLLTDVFWPAWEWAAMEMPHLRYVAFSYSASLTERDNGRFRDLMMHPDFQAVYASAFRLRKTGETKITNDKHGFKLATSVGGVGTGERGDRIILDDPHNVKESESEVVRDETVRWFRESMSSRLNDISKSAVVIIMQRVHEDDVSGNILATELDYVHLLIPMRFVWDADEEGEPYSTEIGWIDPRWTPDADECDGELAWPDRFPEDETAKLEDTLGPYATAGQMQQTPEPRGGGIIKREFWQPWPLGAKFPAFSYIFASLDGAFTEDEQNDPSALTIWGTFENDEGNTRAMLVFAWRKFLQFEGRRLYPDKGENQREFMERQMKEWGLVEWTQHSMSYWKCDRLLIEAKASGISTAQSLEARNRNKNWSVQLEQVKGDKVARALAVQPTFSQHMIYAPVERAWCKMVIDECAVFPKGKYVDLTDSVSQAIKHMRDMGLLQYDEDIRAQQVAEARLESQQARSENKLRNYLPGT